MSTFKKFVAGFLMVATLTAGSPVVAVTIEELLAQITALQAQLTALQGGSGSGSGAGVGMLTKTLKKGMTDAEVTILQKGLAKDSSVYPEGLSTGYFGTLTFNAVVKFQEKYASEILTPNGLTSGTGFVGASTRAKFNALYGGTGGSGPPAPAGSVSVAMSPATPGATTLVADSLSTDGTQALAEVATFRLTAPASGSVRVTSLKVHRTGISSDNDVSNMYLYVDGVRVGEAPSISSGYYTFTNSSGMFLVSSGSYKDVVVKIDLANGTTSGKTLQFGLVASADVVSDAGTVVGTFPMHGSVMTTATVGDLGKMTIQTALPSSNSSVDAGTLNHELFRFSALSSDQPTNVSYMRFVLVGTADYDALQNLKLYVDGVQVGSTVSMMSNDKSVAFNLAGSPLAFTSGQTRTVSLRGDVIKGSGRNYYFQVGQAADFVVMDKTYNIYVKTNQSNVWTLFKAAGTTSISEGSITVTRSTTSPTGPMALNATNMEIAKFEAKAVGEDIRISSIVAKVDDTANLIVSNLKVLIEGSQIGSTVAAPADNTNQTFSGNYTFPAGVTKIITIKADLTGTLTSSSVITASLVDTNASNGIKMSSGASLDVPSSTQAGNGISITSGGLTATKNPSIANISSVVGAQGVIIASWLITAPSDQAVRVNAVTVDDGQSTSGTDGLGSGFNNLMLYNGSTQYGQTIASPSTTGGADNAFNFSTGLEVPAGQSIQLDLKANILSSASTSVWAGTGAVDVARIVSIDATGIVTNSAATYSSSTVDGQTITLAAGATLTVANESSPTMPDSQYLVAGDTAQTLAAWKFTANNTEDVKVTRIKIFESGTDDDPGNLKNVKLYVGGVQVGSTIPAFTTSAATSTVGAWTMDYVLFENTAGLFTVPKNTSVTVVAKADMTDNANATFSADGNLQRFSLEITDGAATATTNVSGIGSTSSQLVTLESGGSATNDLDGSSMKVVKTKPTFALVAAGTDVLLPGTMEVFRFRVTAHSAEDVVFASGTHNILLTVLAGKAAASGSVIIYDASTGTALNTLSAGTSLATGGTANFVGLTSTIAKGTTKEYYVTANLAGFTVAGDSFQVKIGNAAADLSWSDNTSSADIEDDNYVGIGLPITGGVFVKP